MQAGENYTHATHCIILRGRTSDTLPSLGAHQALDRTSIEDYFRPRMSKTYRIGVIGRTARGDYGHGIDAVWLEVPNAQIVGMADDDKVGRRRSEGSLEHLP